MYRWLLQLSPETVVNIGFFSFLCLYTSLPSPFWNMVVNTSTLDKNAECFCDCSTIFISSSLVYFFLLFVCECMCVWRTEAHRHSTGWLFSWFIIINHCNDSFIPTKCLVCFTGTGKRAVFDVYMFLMWIFLSLWRSLCEEVLQWRFEETAVAETYLKVVIENINLVVFCL